MRSTLARQQSMSPSNLKVQKISDMYWTFKKVIDVDVLLKINSSCYSCGFTSKAGTRLLLRHYL